MTENLKFEGGNHDESTNNDCIVIRSAREITGIFSLEKYFKKELKKLSIEDTLSEEVSVKNILQVIKGMRNNTILLQKENKYMLIETDIFLGDYVALRKGKLLLTGTYIDCAKAIVKQIKKDFPDKDHNLTFADIDENWLHSFGTIHKNDKRFYRIINLK